MGYKCTFMDNDIYYAKDVNAMFANLASEGVVLADSGNLLSDLNTAVSDLTSEGVQTFLDSCKLTYADGVYKIGEGVCFLPDGSAITFDADGYEVSPVMGTKNYVYLKRNETNNTIDVVTALLAGGSGTVPIAEINADGEIIDTRKYSRAKVRLNQPNGVEAFSFSMWGESEKDVYIGWSDFTRIIVNGITMRSSTGTVYEYKTTGSPLNDLTEGVRKDIYMKREDHTSSDFILFVTKNANTIRFGFSGTSPAYNYTINFEVIA